VLEYARVADSLTARIGKGEFAPGARLPGELALAGEYGVAYGTVRRALQVLRGRGAVVTLWGKGTFVAGTGKP
jgi:GntR family transcriptional regulator